MRHLCPDFYGATYEKMGELGFIQWPCRDTSDADQGTSYLFKEKFDTPNGLAQFFTCDWVAPIDKLTDEYPMVLSTVREVGHYSCRSMTGNCAALAALADELATHKSIPKTPNVWVLKMRHWFGCTRVKAKLSPVRRSAIVRTKGRFI